MRREKLRKNKRPTAGTGRSATDSESGENHDVLSPSRLQVVILKTGIMKKSATKGGYPENRNFIHRKSAISATMGKYYTYLCILLGVIIVLVMTFFIASKGLANFIHGDVGVFDFLFGTKWNPNAEPPLYGAFPFILGSFLVTFFAVLVSTPLSVGAAVFMAEISPKAGRKYLQPVIELLVGIPSVVYGFIGLTVIVPFIRTSFGGIGFSLAAGMLVLSVMILPTITSVSYNAMKALPVSYKNASYALGATRWQTIRRVLLPAALPDVLTGVVLGMARAFGEALAVQMVIGNAKKLPHSLLDPISTLTSALTLEMTNTIPGTAYNNVLWSMALILLMMSFLFIAAIRMLGKRNRAK